VPDKLMPDHWGYVVAAYGLAAAAVVGYWRHLVRRARALAAARRGERTAA
jgi:cytochrome oxidase assembly protein ShyY1